MATHILGTDLIGRLRMGRMVTGPTVTASGIGVPTSIVVATLSLPRRAVTEKISYA